MKLNLYQIIMHRNQNFQVKLSLKVLQLQIGMMKIWMMIVDLLCLRLNQDFYLQCLIFKEGLKNINNLYLICQLMMSNQPHQFMKSLLYSSKKGKYHLLHLHLQFSNPLNKKKRRKKMIQIWIHLQEPEDKCKESLELIIRFKLSNKEKKRNKQDAL